MGMAHRALGFGVSAALHAAIVAALLFSATRALPRRRVPGATNSSPIVMPAEDLTPTARVDDLGLHLESLTVPLPGFDFDAGKVIARAGSLFPFLTRRPFVDHAVGRSRAARARLAWAGLVAEREVPAIAPELVLSDAS